MANATPPGHSSHVALVPFGASTETTSYVAHHLKIAGRPDQLFAEDALSLIHTTSRGYPRAVNNVSLQGRRNRHRQEPCRRGRRQRRRE